jgi:hypothetical protein
MHVIIVFIIRNSINFFNDELYVYFLNKYLEILVNFIIFIIKEYKIKAENMVIKIRPNIF